MSWVMTGQRAEKQRLLLLNCVNNDLQSYNSITHNVVLLQIKFLKKKILFPDTACVKPLQTVRFSFKWRHLNFVETFLHNETQTILVNM